MQYSLSTIRIDGAAVAVIEVSGRYYRLDAVAPELLRAAPARGLMNLFDDWAAADQALLALAERLAGSDRGLVSPAPAWDAFLTPLQYPAKVMLGGANYYEHMFKEANKPDFRKEDNDPVFFLKPPSTSLVGPGRTVRYPTQSKKFDWEIELAAVVGRRMKRVSEEEAWAGIAGFTVGIDFSARDWQLNPRHPWKFDLFGGKAFDDSCPLGPKIVPARFVNPRKLHLQLKVNGAIKQDASTDDMIWSVGEQLALLSQHATLEPGDVLLTGTPAGVGMASGTYLKVGDRVDASIEGLGTLSVEIIADH